MLAGKFLKIKFVCQRRDAATASEKTRVDNLTLDSPTVIYISVLTTAAY